MEGGRDAMCTRVGRRARCVVRRVAYVWARSGGSVAGGGRPGRHARGKAEQRMGGRAWRAQVAIEVCSRAARECERERERERSLVDLAVLAPR